MAIGDPLQPSAQNNITISAAPGALGASIDPSNDKYYQDSQYVYANKGSEDVAFQQAKQNMPSGATVEEVKAQLNAIRSSADYKAKLAEAESIRRASVPVGFLGGMYTEVIPGRLTYDKQLIAAKSEVENSYKELANTSTMREWQKSYPQYLESIEKYNSISKTDPNSFPTQKINRYVQGDMSIGSLSPAQIAASNAQTASVLAEQVASGRMSADTARMMIDTGDSNQPTQLSSMLNYLLTPSQTSVQQQTVATPTPSSDYLSKISGYTLDIGDSKTQSLMGQGIGLRDALEIQRQQASNSGDTRAARYYQNELDKSLQNVIRLSSDYHYQAKESGLRQAPNPYENAGDVALMILKGGNQKMVFGSDGKPVNELASSYAFNKDATNILSLLPGGKGTQENAWDNALGRSTGKLNYLPALSALKSAEKSYGPYAFLGSYDQMGNKIPVPAANIAQLPQYYQDQITNMGKPVQDTNVSGFQFKMPFLSTLPGSQTQQKTTVSTPFGILGATNILASEVNKQTPSEQTTVTPAPFLSSLSQQQEKEEPRALSFGGFISDTVKMGKELKSGNLGGAYGFYNQAISRFTTLPVMLNADWVAENPNIRNFVGGLLYPGTSVLSSQLGTEKSAEGKKFVTDVAINVPLGVYNYVRKNPVDVPFMYAGGEAIPALEYGGAKFLSWAAQKEMPLLSKGAQVISKSPLSKDIYTGLTRGVLPAYFTYETGKYILGDENADKSTAARSQRLGESAAKLGLLIKGATAESYPGVNNPYHPKEYSPLEKLSNRLNAFKDTINKPEGQKVAMRELIQPAEQTRFITPAKTTENIDLSHLTGVGKKYAPAVEEAASRQVTSMYGSGTIEAGASDLPTGKILKQKALPSHDYDNFATSPEKFRTDLADITGGKVITSADGKATVISRSGDVIGVDSHPFPEGYADIGQIKSTNAGEYSGTSVNFKVNPYLDELTRPGETVGYSGKLTYEQMNVQLQKSMSDLYTDLGDPLNKGYRIPKAATRTKLMFDDLVAVAKERKLTPAQEAALNKAKLKMENAYKQEITYKDENGIIRTEKINDALNRYVESKRPIFDDMPRPTPTEDTIIRYPSMSKVSGVSALSGSLIQLSKNFSKQFKGTPSTSSKALFSSPSPKYSIPSIPSIPSPKPPSPGPSSPGPSSPGPSSPGPSLIDISITSPIGGSDYSFKGGSVSSSIYNSSSYTPGGYTYISSSSYSPSSSSRPPKTPSIPGYPFMMPPGVGGGGAGRGGSRSIKVVNPIQKLTVATSATAARFNKAFGGRFKAISTVKPQGRGNTRPIMSIKPQKASKKSTAKSISNNIGKMFGKKKKGRVF